MGRKSKYDWDDIRLDISLGMSQADVVVKHKVPFSTLSTHLRSKPVIPNLKAKSAIAGFEVATSEIAEVIEGNKAVAEKVIDILESKHPQFKKQLATLTSNLLTRANQLIKDSDAQGISHLAKGIQTATDTVGITQRHAPRASTTMNVQQNTHVVQASGDLADFLADDN